MRVCVCVCVTADNPFILCPCLRGASWGHFLYAPSLGKPPLPQGSSLVTSFGCSLEVSCPAVTLCSVNHLCSVSGPDLCFLRGLSILLLFNGDKPLPFAPAETTSISHQKSGHNLLTASLLPFFGSLTVVARMFSLKHKSSPVNPSFKSLPWLPSRASCLSAVGSGPGPGFHWPLPCISLCTEALSAPYTGPFSSFWLELEDGRGALLGPYL